MQTVTVENSGNNQGYINPGNYNLHTLEMISLNSSRLDLGKMFTQINIYEDLMNNCMYGKVYIEDALDLIQHFPIIGQEALIITWSTPGSKRITKRFQIKGISDRATLKSDKVQLYALEFVSPEFYNNLQTRLSKSYSGKISKIVPEIFKTIIGLDNKIAVQETNEEIKIVVPNERPLETINYLAARAQSNDNTNDCSYVFYQDADAYRFVSLLELSKRHEFGTYTRFAPQSNTTNQIVDSHFNIIDFKILANHDKITQIPQGAFASTLINHDITTKQIVEVKPNYFDRFDKVENIDKYPVIPRVLQTLTNYPNSYYESSYSHSYCFDGFKNNISPTNIFLQRRMQLLGFYNFRMNITISGDSRLRVGDVLKLNFPTMGASSETDWQDKYLSGRWLVTAINHQMSSDSYSMVLELSKNSVQTPYPDIKNLKFI